MQVCGGRIAGGYTVGKYAGIVIQHALELSISERHGSSCTMAAIDGTPPQRPSVRAEMRNNM